MKKLIKWIIIGKATDKKEGENTSRIPLNIQISKFVKTCLKHICKFLLLVYLW